MAPPCAAPLARPSTHRPPCRDRRGRHPKPAGTLAPARFVTYGDLHRLASPAAGSSLAVLPRVHGSDLRTVDPAGLRGVVGQRDQAVTGAVEVVAVHVAG